MRTHRIGIVGFLAGAAASVWLMGLTLEPGLPAGVMPDRLRATLSDGKLVVTYAPTQESGLAAATSPLILFVRSQGALEATGQRFPMTRRGAGYGATIPLDTDALYVAMKVEAGDRVDDAERAGYVFLLEDNPGTPRRNALRHLAIHLQSAVRRKGQVPPDLPLALFNQEIQAYPDNREARVDRYSALDDETKKKEEPELRKSIMDAMTRGSADDLWFARYAYRGALYDPTQARNAADELATRYPDDPRAEEMRLDALRGAHFIKFDEEPSIYSALLESPAVATRRGANLQLLQDSASFHADEQTVKYYEELKKVGFPEGYFSGPPFGAVIQAAGAVRSPDYAEQVFKDARDWNENRGGLDDYLFWLRPVDRRGMQLVSLGGLYQARVNAAVSADDPDRAEAIFRDSRPYLPDSRTAAENALTLSAQFEEEAKPDRAWDAAVEGFDSDPTDPAILDRLMMLYVGKKGTETEFSAEMERLRKSWRENAGPAAPAIQLTDTGGMEARLADQKGKVVVLYIWAAWAPDMYPEIDGLNRICQKYGADPRVEFWAMTQDSPAAVADALKRTPFGFRQFSDARSQPWALGVQLLGALLVVDGKGDIRLRRGPPIGADVSWLDEAIQDLLPR